MAKRIFNKLVATAMALSAGFRVRMDATLYQLREQMAMMAGGKTSRKALTIDEASFGPNHPSWVPASKDK